MVVQFGQQQDQVAPGQLVNRLLTNWRIGIGQSEHPYVFEVGHREAGHVREFRVQVSGERFDHPRAPTLGRLRLHDGHAELPVKRQQLGVDRQLARSRALRTWAFRVASSAP